MIGPMFSMDKRTLTETLREALTVYQQRMGTLPKQALVNPGDLEKAQARGETFPALVKPVKYVLPGVVWVGS